jgi:hypothetical protein
MTAADDDGVVVIAERRDLRGMTEDSRPFARPLNMAICSGLLTARHLGFTYGTSG